RNVIGHKTLRMLCATPMGHRAKASHCLILGAGLQNKGSCCDQIRRSDTRCNSVDEGTTSEAIAKSLQREILKLQGCAVAYAMKQGSAQSSKLRTTPLSRL